MTSAIMSRMTVLEFLVGAGVAAGLIGIAFVVSILIDGQYRAEIFTSSGAVVFVALASVLFACQRR